MKRLAEFLLVLGFCGAILILGWSLIHHRIHKVEVSALTLVAYLVLAGIFRK